MRTCSIDGCERKHNAHGYCQVHGMRVRRHGDPHVVKPRGCYQGVLPSVIPIGWLPPDAGQPMPYSETLIQRRGALEWHDDWMDRYSERRYDMTCDAEGIWTFGYRERRAA